MCFGVRLVVDIYSGRGYNGGMNTSICPRTYAEAAKIAEAVTVEEFAQMLAEDDAPIIFAGPRKDAHIPLNVLLRVFESGLACVVYTYCKRSGYNGNAAVTVGGCGVAVFSFDNGRTVKVVSGGAS